MMLPKLSSKEERDTLVKEYMASRNRLRRRFENEAIGEIDLQVEAAKLFKPITAEAEKQTAAITSASAEYAKELQKVTDALERAQIAPKSAEERSAPLTIEASPSKRKEDVYVNPDQDLDMATIRRYKFMPPSELDLNDSKAISGIIEGINHINRYTLGGAKKRATITESDKEAITKDINALKAYRERLRLLTEGYKLTMPHNRPGGSAGRKSAGV